MLLHSVMFFVPLVDSDYKGAVAGYFTTLCFFELPCRLFLLLDSPFLLCFRHPSTQEFYVRMAQAEESLLPRR